MRPIILASASPRRAALLTQIGLPFEVMVSEVDESGVSFENPARGAMTLALRKAETVAERIAEPERVVLGADTVVVLDDRILGKPGGPAEAAAMLRRLAGRSHRVITGLALVESGTVRRSVFHEQTTVYMRACGDAEIAAYVATGEPLDKAGAYGAQGYGGCLIERVEGCFYNVVGLPLARLVTALRAFKTL
jgi:septum formation protein